MLHVRKRCVNWLYLAISWPGPCRLLFLGLNGREGESVLLGPTWKGIPEEWKGSTGKWASLCRSRETGHASLSSFFFVLLRWGLSWSQIRSIQEKGKKREMREERGRSRGTFLSSYFFPLSFFRSGNSSFSLNVRFFHLDPSLIYIDLSFYRSYSYCTKLVLFLR